MADSLSRRDFAALVAAGATASTLPGTAREPLTAPKPPVPRGLGTQAALLYEVLLSQFPESRVEAKRDEIARDIATNLYYGRVLASAGLTHFDGPGPLWTAYRATDGETP
ncbi:hypothetical protein [Alienimonas chondri]|uniref:Twin-arginine translocation signal domain-containing protein n=1 Tax=Alienimonas chondri TaxID=2681879 RepID=A0ABX1VDN6_9PLAN|nr:hypothetical protein [Alienimonas chondri]NNJ25819.1 hypothetical protein [Alienimonas chondri]